jgi:hypothetical protein
LSLSVFILDRSIRDQPQTGKVIAQTLFSWFRRDTIQMDHESNGIGWSSSLRVDLIEMMVVARDGIEPPTPAFSGPSTESPKWFEINERY